MLSVSKITFTFLLSGLCAAYSPAKAQQATQDQNTAFNKLVAFAANNDDFDRAVEKKARDLFKRQIPNCKIIGRSIRQIPTPYGTIIFDQTNDSQAAYPPPSNGIWAEHIKVQACKRIWTINILAVAAQKGAPSLFALLPGDTKIDPSTAHDTERIGAITVRKVDGNACADEASVVYTHFLGYLQPSGKLGKTDAQKGWFEQWDYDFCNRQVPVQMAFMPSDIGGYKVKARVVPTAAPSVPQTKPTTPAKK